MGGKMSKEYLEAFGRITSHTEYDNDSSYDSLNFEDDCKLVDEALERLEEIDNADSSEAIKHMEFICKILKEKGIDVKWVFKEDYKIIIHALQRLDRYEQILGSGRLTDRNYKNTTLALDSSKPYLRLGQLEDIYEDGKKHE